MVKKIDLMKKNLNDNPAIEFVLGLAKTNFDKRTYNNFKKEVNSIIRNSPIPGTKTSVDGPLSQFGSAMLETLGAWNPSSIPDYIRERMSRHPTIALGLFIIKSVPISLTYEIQCKDNIQRMFIKKQIDKTYRATIRSLCNAVKMGLACGEKEWKFYEKYKIKNDSKNGKIIYNDSAWVLEDIRFIYPSGIRMRIDENGKFLGIRQEKSNGTSVSVDKEKLVLYSHEIEYSNYFGSARIDNCYSWWYWGLIITHFALKYYERKGNPTTIMNAPPGTRTVNGTKIDNMEFALQVGQAATGQTVISLPSEFDKATNQPLWGMKYLLDDQRGDMFMQMLNHVDTKLLRALLIPDKMGLASDGSPHSSSGVSAGDTLDVFMMSEQALVSDFEDIYNSQIIPFIQEYNFDKDKIEDAKINIEKLDYNKKLLLKDVLLRMIMLSGGSIRDGAAPKILPSIERLCEILGVPMDMVKNIFSEIQAPTKTNNLAAQDNEPQNKGDAAESPSDNRRTDRKDRSPRERSLREGRR